MDEQGSKKYEVLRRIGEGGMAEVYLAEMRCQPGYHKRVAIKRVLPRLVASKRFLGMFLDEARLGLLLNHSNIVNVIDVGRSGASYFIVMEYVDGVNLKQMLKLFARRRQQVPLETTLAIAIEICRGLHYAHRLTDAEGNLLHVVHNDINPANVLLSINGEVKLVDFGLSEAGVHVEKIAPDIVRGKLGYLSPETAYGYGTDARTDIFTTGIMIYEMVTGQPLFDARDAEHAVQLARTAFVPPVTELNPVVPPSLEEVLGKALARDPNDRYPDAERFGRALSEVLFELGRPVSGFAIGDLVEIVRDDLRGSSSERAALIELMIEEELLGFESLEHDDPVADLIEELGAEMELEADTEADDDTDPTRL